MAKQDILNEYGGKVGEVQATGKDIFTGEQRHDILNEYGGKVGEIRQGPSVESSLGQIGRTYLFLMVVCAFIPFVLWRTVWRLPANIAFFVSITAVVVSFLVAALVNQEGVAAFTITLITLPAMFLTAITLLRLIIRGVRG